MDIQLKKWLRWERPQEEQPLELRRRRHRLQDQFLLTHRHHLSQIPQLILDPAQLLRAQRD